MAKYRKRPIEVEAIQINVWNDPAVLDFLMRHVVPFEIVGDHEIVIHTLEGDMFAGPRDWIIKGVKGECYPCKPDVFELTYELVS